MRIVVVGATGNVGTSVLESLGRDESVESVLGLARRLPAAAYPKTTFAAADVSRDDLVAHFRGADCVVPGTGARRRRWSGGWTRSKRPSPTFASCGSDRR